MRMDADIPLKLAEKQARKQSDSFDGLAVVFPEGSLTIPSM